MDAIETLLKPIRRSPRLVEAARLLNRQIERERRQRKQFYEKMSLDEKVEFIDGKVIHHSPSRKDHLDVTKRLLKLLDTYVSIHNLGVVLSEKCLCVFPRNDYEPDIVFFGRKKAAHLQPNTLKFPIPDLIVEVLSRSTEQRDRGVKFEDYAAHGVGEYWIIDAQAQAVERYCRAKETYLPVPRSPANELQSRIIKGLSLPVAAVFDEVENLKALRQILASPSGGR